MTVEPVRTLPVLVWRVSSDDPGYFGGDQTYQHVELTVRDDVLFVEADRYTYEAGHYESWVTAHDAATGLRLWGEPREPVARSVKPPMTRAGDVVYTVVPGNVLVARDTVAERTLWQLTFSTRIAAVAAVSGGLFVLAEGGHLTLLGASR